MRRIERDWLRRIPGYGQGEDASVLKRKPGTGVPKEDGDEIIGREPENAAEDGTEGLAPEGAEDETESPDDSQKPGDEPPSAQDGENGGEETEPAQAQPPGLSLPDEVEREREEQARNAESRHNPNLAPQAFALEGRHMRGLAARFARMVSKVAEDSADLPSQGDEEWDLTELRQRRFTGRLVSQCRMTREKRKVAVVLDTSPSCEHQARLFGAIARVAEDLGDCELFDAPNFAIHARKLGEAWESLPEAERDWQFQRRVVLAFGDFDGIERISAASATRGNKIYWFCCEERPDVLESNREFFVKRYKGHYFPTAHLHGLMKAMRKVR